ncbi:MAG: SDR family oxidoreductase, partial [Spirochaetales bacterium]|nr:SDR family oxidoreductase [Spirochaetales bacterium]
FKAYAASRLATVFFTQELAARLEPRNVTANCLHPGHVATGMWNLWPKRKLLGRIIGSIMSRFLMTPDQGAETTLYLALSEDPAGITGKYFSKSMQADANPQCANQAVQQRLWKLSEELTGIASR